MKVNAVEIRENIERLRRRAPGAIARSLERSAKSGRAFMAKKIADDTGLGSKYVTKDLTVEVYGEDHADIVVLGNRIPLIAFNARDVRPAGVAYKLTGGQGKAPHGFIATMRSGHRGAWSRTRWLKGGKAEKGPSGREKIAELKGPSLPHVFMTYLPDGAAHAGEQLRKNLEHEIEFALR